MKFYVIDKSGAVSIEASDIKAAAADSTVANPFMIVAASYVKEGECYQAIQVSDDKVLLNKKPGHEYVTAASIKEALAAGTEEDEDEEESVVEEEEPVVDYDESLENDAE